ncbi:MAG: hypothetical protein LBU19_00270 [Treponema sp.]|nr:hypothetical protein [Treponema sp.]
MLKAADAAIKEGVLDPSYYAYQNNPALLKAKIETPMLVFDASTGSPGSYILNAVDANGISLALVSVSSALNVDKASFELGRAITEENGPSIHLITKQEATSFIRGGSNTQEPALRFAGEPLGRFNSCTTNGGVADPQYNKFPIDRQVFLRKT